MTDDDPQVARIRVYLDGGSVAIAEGTPPTTVTIDTLRLPDGEHVLRIEALDSTGNIGLRDVPFRVRNGPGITVTGLREHAHVRGELTFTANAFGADDPFEPQRAESPSPIPVWVWVMMLLIVGWAGWYLIETWKPPAKFAATPTFATNTANRNTSSRRSNAKPGADSSTVTAVANDSVTVPAADNSATTPATGPSAVTSSAARSTGTTPAAASAAQIAQQGNGNGAPACASCHGGDGGGNSTAGFPRLVGLSTAYLEEQLDALADGRRQNAVMGPVAKALSNSQRHALAAYYATLPASTVAAADTTQQPDANSLGKQLALRGRWADGVPACVSCHGNQGSGVGQAFPALAGQSSLYIANQLRAWQLGTRADGPLALMPTIAHKLTDQDIHAVAGYFAELSLPVVAATRTRGAP